ncbi:MAG: hypothetical protein VKQ33_16510, partial [Candidatus Sericytochromatia bacterium]|nr:hypothetical protein [Candidatus Sericytochromatia bacterium]
DPNSSLLFLSPTWFMSEHGFFTGLELQIKLAEKRFKFQFAIKEVDFPTFGTDRVFESKEVSAIVSDVLKTLPITAVHIHHFMHWGILDTCKAAVDNNIPYAVSLHDYYLLCPSHNLLDKSNQHCGIPSNCSSCIPNFGLTAKQLRKWRDSAHEVLVNASHIVVPSKIVSTYFEKVFGPQLVSRFEIISHGIYSEKYLEQSSGERLKLLKQRRERLLNTSAPLSIALVGDLSIAKGGDLIKAILKRINNDNKLCNSFRFIACGRSHFKRSDYPNVNIVIREEFTPEALMWFLADADVFLSLSVSPETYMLVGDEVAWAGLPSVSGSLGAFADRIAEHNLGWLVDLFSTESIIQILADIRGKKKNEFFAVLDRLIAWRPSSHEMIAEEYKKLFNTSASTNRHPYSFFETPKVIYASQTEAVVPQAGEGAVFEVLKSVGLGSLKFRYPRLWAAVRHSILALPAPLRDTFFGHAKKLRAKVS